MSLEYSPTNRGNKNDKWSKSWTKSPDSFFYRRYKKSKHIFIAGLQKVRKYKILYLNLISHYFSLYLPTVYDSIYNLKIMVKITFSYLMTYTYGVYKFFYCQLIITNCCTFKSNKIIIFTYVFCFA